MTTINKKGLAFAAVILLLAAAIFVGAAAGDAAASLQTAEGDESNTVKENCVTIKNSDDKTEYDTIALAAAAHGESGTTYVIHGTLKYDMPSKGSGSYTFEGAEGTNPTLDMSQMGAYTQAGMSLTFKNLKYYKAPTKPYEGFAHAAEETYVNCIIECEWRTYGETMTFTGCTFLPPKDTKGDYESAYNVFIYGSTTVTFDACDFTSTGKAIKVFSESPTPRKTVNISGCSFTIDGTHKISGKQHPAVQFSCHNIPGKTDGGAYDVTIENCTATGFTISESQDAASYLLNTLWGDECDAGSTTDASGTPYLDLTVKSPVTIADNIQHGSISVDKTVGTSHVSEGKVTESGTDTITVTASPDTGYYLESVTVTSGEYSSVEIPVTISGNTATFAMYPWPVTVSAVMADAKIKTATASADSYNYSPDGSTKTQPKLDKDIGETPSFYASTSPVQDVGTGYAWNSTVLNAGTYYVYAQDSDGNQSKRSSFTVNQIAQADPDFGVSVDSTGIVHVTIKNYDERKTYEYKIEDKTAANTDQNDVWRIAPEASFTIAGQKAGTHTLTMKAAESINYTESTGVAKDFTIAADSFTVSYNANGGTGSTTQASVGGKVILQPTSIVSRVGYTAALDWYETSDGTGTPLPAGSEVTEGKVLYAKWNPNNYTVKFDGNGATSGSMANQDFTYSTSQNLTKNDFVNGDKTFAGWAKTADGKVVYADEQEVQGLAESGTITLYAVWVTNPHKITANIINPPTNNILVTLKRGNAQIAQKTINPAENASCTFEKLPSGNYNLVADAKGNDGKVIKTVTSAVILGNTDKEVEITFPIANVDSKVTVSEKENTPAVVVGNLDKEAEAKAEGDQKVTVTLSVEAKTEAEPADDASMEEKQVQKSILAIKEMVPSAVSENPMMFLEISVNKQKAGETKSEPIRETSNVIELIVPYDFTGKENTKVFVYRVHDGKYEPLENNSSENDGTYQVKKSDGLIHIYTQMFSTYSIGYSTESSKPSSGGSSSQGSSTWLTDDTPVDPKVNPTPTPTPGAVETPSVKPVTPTETPAKTPAPFLGIIAGLGAAAVVFGLRRK